LINNAIFFNVKRPAPKDEDEMMVAIFECIDRLFRIVRPRKVLYMAIDGVVSYFMFIINDLYLIQLIYIYMHYFLGS